MLDMTNGNSLKQIIIFAIPLFISSIFQQLYNICDTMMLGKMVGIEALAAAGASMPLFFLIVIVSIGFTRGLTVMVGQSFGAKNFSLLRKYIASSFILSLTFVSVIAVCNYFMLEQILIFMNVPDNIVISTISYLSIICYASFFIVLFNLVSAILQAVGDSKTPLYFLILSTKHKT